MQLTRTLTHGVWKYLGAGPTLALLFLGLSPGMAAAHSPHDVIDAVAAVTAQDGEMLAWALVSGDLVIRSADRGLSWTELTQGLDTRYEFTDISAGAGADGELVAVATDGDGVLASTDLGETWRHVTGAAQGSRFAHVWVMDASGWLLAATHSGALYETRDTGAQWTTVSINGEVTAAAKLSNDGALVVGTRDGKIYRTTGDRSSWTRAETPPTDGAITSLAVSGRTVLAGTESAGVLRSTDGGGSFSPSASAVAGQNVRSIAVDGQTSVFLLITWKDGAFRSEDGGETWTASSVGLTTDPQANQPLHLSPEFIDVAVADGSDHQPTWLVAGFDGLFRSDSGGRSWHEVQTLLPGRIMATALSPDANGSHCLALATYGGGAYRWCSGKERWQVLNDGLGRLRLAGMVYSPGYASDGLLLTGAPEELWIHRAGADAGWSERPVERSWTYEHLPWFLAVLHSHLALPRSVTTDLLDARHYHRPFPVNLAVPADFPQDDRIFVTTRRHGLIQLSMASHATTVLLDSEKLFGEVLPSPGIAKDHTLFLTARQRGILVSRDDGATWSPMNDGLDYLDAWRSQSQQPGRAYEAERSAAFANQLALSPAFATDGTAFVGSSAGLYRRDRAAPEWQRVGAGLPANPFILALAVSPSLESDGVVAVSVKGEGLYLSHDGGSSFDRAGAATEPVHRPWIKHLAFSPTFARDRTIYAASENTVFRSTDGGARWQPMADRPVRYEGFRGALELTGHWKRIDEPQYSGATAWASTAAGDRMVLPFVGNGFRVLGSVAHPADLEVIIDGKSITGAADDSPPSVDDLDCGFHRLELRTEASQPASPAGAEPGVLIDAIDVLGSSCPR